MEAKNIYTLPQLPYGYKDLEPFISEQQLTIHHQKHHQAYVNGANAIFEKLDKSRVEKSEIDMKSALKELSFNIGGYLLHSLFWENMSPQNKKGGKMPEGVLADAINNEFGDLERFKKEFTQTALFVEGSGWAALTFDKEAGKLIIMQIEKHNINIYPAFNILLVLDVFEHAYYLDYKNERAKFIDAFWNIINWSEVEKRFGNY
jgi:superoxide dismutase, Fe-Mn family